MNLGFKSDKIVENQYEIIKNKENSYENSYENQENLYENKENPYENKENPYENKENSKELTVFQKMELWLDSKTYNIRALLISIAIILTITITVCLILYYNTHCANGDQKAKNGDCCKYGKTVKNKVCYKTSCKTGKRNVNGYCCKNGVTNKYYKNINCNTTNCPVSDVIISDKIQIHGNTYLCCLYGVTRQREKCYTTSCQSTLYADPYSRSIIHGKCCVNGITINHARCNSTKCDEIDCSMHGKCCNYGVAIHSSHCNTIQTRSGAYIQNCNSFANSGTCCVNGKTANNNHCNQKCSYHNGFSGVTRYGICCEYGATHDRASCNSSKCHGRTIGGNCCDNGVALNNNYCNDICDNNSSCHTSKGKCQKEISCF